MLSRLTNLAARCAGCSTDFLARRLLLRSSVPGRVRLMLVGGSKTLLRRAWIDQHRREAVDDGITLDVWVIRGRGGDGGGDPAGPRGTVLILHGLWDSKGRFLGLGERLGRMGFDVVLPDLRAHGRSTGRLTTYGALEKRDVRVLMDRLLAAGEVREPLYVFGFSMGAAIAVQYAAADPRCRGVTAVAPFQDARAIVRRACPLMREAKYRAVWARAAEIAGFDPDDTSAVRAAATLACPLLLVHGRLDNIVPYSHGRAVFRAAPQPKRMITVPWSGHIALLIGRQRWFADRMLEMTRMGRTETAPVERSP